MTLFIRYKAPDSDKSEEIEFALKSKVNDFNRASKDLQFAAAVAAFGMLLRNSPHKGNATMEAVAEIAHGSKGTDRHGYRAEFVNLVKKAKSLRK